MKHLVLITLINFVFTASLYAECNSELEKTFENLRISHGWLRAMPEGVNSSGYLKIKNLGSKDTRLMSIKADFAEKTNLHLMKEEYGVMKMISMIDGVQIPAGSQIEFEPGGLHIMFIKLIKPLEVNKIKKAVLSFENLGSTSVNFCIKKITAKNYYSSDK